MLYPVEHWQDVAKATRENIAALRKGKQEELAKHPHAMHSQIHARYAQIEKDMGEGLNMAIKRHQQFISNYPKLKDFRWSRSDPPQSHHKDRIAPGYPESPHHEEFKRKQQRMNQRKPQTFQGRRLKFN